MYRLKVGHQQEKACDPGYGQWPDQIRVQPDQRVPREPTHTLHRAMVSSIREAYLTLIIRFLVVDVTTCPEWQKKSDLPFSYGKTREAVFS